ncbi:unnamed protein product [Darwinula stevensoni]|uniref:NADP-dependent oxidoreductase domain-containing protein n=1 Tax=Darwinula stevensoni TaxID=69355 RepID=A0A7R8XAD1_9CRUS|nr:unnamed protein product [Darwinula stevensoni]CAG0883657.1 unnamed protein product [Darwinula stevensoni]
MKPQARPTLKPVIPGIKLSSGAEMPIIGLGTFMAKPEEVENTLDVALEAGYRHIDTAYLYENEAAIGKTLQKWMNSGKIKREELFIVTKLPMIGNRAKDVMHFMEKSLEALELEYVDLYLVHCAFGMEKRSDKELFPQNQDGTFALDMKTDIISVWKVAWAFLHFLFHMALVVYVLLISKEVQ